MVGPTSATNALLANNALNSEQESICFLPRERGPRVAVTQHCGQTQDQHSQVMLGETVTAREEPRRFAAREK